MTGNLGFYDTYSAGIDAAYGSLGSVGTTMILFTSIIVVVL